MNQSDKHKEAMAYIYGKCKRGVNLYNEPIFVVSIGGGDVLDIKDLANPRQERWCKQCLRKS
jgi:hypothetical protein